MDKIKYISEKLEQAGLPDEMVYPIEKLLPDLNGSMLVEPAKEEIVKMWDIIINVYIADRKARLELAENLQNSQMIGNSAVLFQYDYRKFHKIWTDRQPVVPEGEPEKIWVIGILYPEKHDGYNWAYMYDPNYLKEIMGAFEIFEGDFVHDNNNNMIGFKSLGDGITFLSLLNKRF